jgi:phosphoserine phosphatase RsbU/P
MTSSRTARELLPDAVVQVLDEFRRGFDLKVHLWLPREGESSFLLYPRSGAVTAPGHDSILLEVPTRDGPDLTLEVRGTSEGSSAQAPANALRTSLEQLYAYAEEIRFFTYEVSERYEEINLLYFISETLGSLLQLKDATRLILAEVCDVMGARRGSLWIHKAEEDRLHLVASVGEDGLNGPLEADDSSAVTSQVFRDGRPLILSGERFGANGSGIGSGDPVGDSVLSVPIRYTPPTGDARTVGVINLIGRRRGGRFTASDQKLLAAIASQVGAALENNRLIQESLERERVTREMELAHNLQMKLLPALDTFDTDQVAARVQPAESVGGDFYHLLRLPAGRVGVMIGDVSSHGFPAALIMALSLSAATIYASEFQSPAQVLNEMGKALRDELESTEMYLTLFYAVVDPERGELVYANAGHPHAFHLRSDGPHERLAALDPPMGIGGDDNYHEQTVSCASGKDLLLLFTDGLSDTLVPGSRMEGERRVVDESIRLREEPARMIVDALFQLGEGGEDTRPDPDDRSVLILKV